MAKGSMQRDSSIEEEIFSLDSIASDVCYKSISKAGNKSDVRFRDSKQKNCSDGSFSSPEIKGLKKKLFFMHFMTKKADGMRRLSLTGNEVFLRRGKRLGDEDVLDLLIYLRDNPKIDELDLSYNEIQCDGFIDIIDHVSNNEEISKLDFRNNEIRSRGIKHLCDCGDKLRLKILKLNGNKFGPECSKRIALMLLDNPFLRELNVSEVDQTAASLVYFTTVLRNDQDLHNAALKILDISCPNPECMYYFDSAHFSSLIGSMLKNNDSLEKLHLQKFGFSCHDIELMLEEGRSNKNLMLLDLSGNNVGDFGAEILANWFSERPALSSLIIAHNIVTSTGARKILSLNYHNLRALSRGLPFSRIKNLDVSYNRIDDSGITEILNTLKKSPCIRQLRLFGNCIGQTSAKILDRMLLSGALVQENLDARPYRIDHQWYCARYSPENRNHE